LLTWQYRVVVHIVTQIVGVSEMGWKTIVKRATRKDTIIAEIDSDFTALAGLGSFFMEMGGIDREDIWRYVEKPYNWQPEYELTVKLTELLDIDDLGELEEYMMDKSLSFFDQQEIKDHIAELEQKSE